MFDELMILSQNINCLFTEDVDMHTTTFDMLFLKTL